MSLTFATIDCQRCEAMRQARFPCPDCGKAHRETETDAHIAWRQHAVAAAIRARSGSTPMLTLAPGELVASGKLLRLPDRIFEAGDAVGRETPTGGAALATIAAEIAQLEAWSERLVLLRPMIAFYEAIRATVSNLVETFDVVLEALTAQTIKKAQACQSLVQQALDQAAEANSKLDELLTTVDDVQGSDDPVGAWLGLAIDGDATEACKKGAALFEVRTGRRCAEGTGLSALAYGRMIATVGDPRRFWQLVCQQIDFLEQNTSGLPAIIQADDFRTRISEVVHDLWAAASRSAKTDGPETARQLATDLLEAGHLVVEQPLKFHLGVGCALRTRRDFPATQGCDVQELVNVALEQVWPLASEFGDTDVRHAFAHRDYRMDGETVILSPHRRGDNARSVSVAELQDSVLQLVETCAAMELALVSVAESLGLGQWANAEGSFLLRPILLALGWEQVEVTEPANGVVVVEANVQPPVAIAALAIAVHPLIGSTNKLILRLKEQRNDQAAVVEVPISLYAEWSVVDDPQLKELAFVRLAAQIILDGKPLMDRAQTGKLIAFRASQLASDKVLELGSIRKSLGQWRAIASEVGLDDLEKDIRRAIRWRAAAEAGQLVDPAEMESLLGVAPVGGC